jgi:hypothetical protein
MTSRRPNFWIILALWGWTSAGTLIAIVVGPDLRPTPELEPLRFAPDFTGEQICARDGYQYLRIVRDGYEWDLNRFDRDDLSSVVFFPGYPLVARSLQFLTRLPLITCLLLVSNISCLAAAWIWSRYTAEQPGNDNESPAFDATLWLLLSPMSLFFRICYSESLFVLLLAAWLYGVQRRWSFGFLAFLAGAASGTRSVGVVLLPVFAWHAWQSTKTPREFLSALCWIPVAAWGLLAYMIYLAIAFHNPLAFAHAQSEWVFKPLSWENKLRELVTFAPIWGCYVPGSRHFWAGLRPDVTLGNSLDFWNPVYFVGAWGLLVLGGVKRWLNATEIILGSLLLLFPYVMIGAENSMQSQARFTVVNLPLYLVLARWTASQPLWRRILVFLISGGLLSWLSIVFGTWGCVF